MTPRQGYTIKTDVKFPPLELIDVRKLAAECREQWSGVETAEPFRGRGLGPRVTAAWALLMRASGRLPIYSTSWTIEPSLAVARKLRLEASASDWSVLD